MIWNEESLYVFFRVIKRIAEALQIFKQIFDSTTACYLCDCILIHSFSSKERRAHANHQKRGHASTPFFAEQTVLVH